MNDIWLEINDLHSFFCFDTCHLLPLAAMVKPVPYMEQLPRFLNMICEEEINEFRGNVQFWNEQLGVEHEVAYWEMGFPSTSFERAGPGGHIGKMPNVFMPEESFTDGTLLPILKKHFHQKALEAIIAFIQQMPDERVVDDWKNDVCQCQEVNSKIDYAMAAWHLVTSAFLLCGTRTAYGTGQGVVARLVAAWSPLLAVTSRLFYVAGVALGDMRFTCVLQA
eukprot:s659_g32.t1